MSAINGISGNVGSTPVSQVSAPPSPPSTSAADGAIDASSPGRADRVEISGAGAWLDALKANGIRTDKVAGIKGQIEAGTYEDDHKLNVAADRLLDDLAG
jgi:anti-sigma28 factor (negative regulator of flagellin synthesis)